jgi:hypothetical protein
MNAEINSEIKDLSIWKLSDDNNLVFLATIMKDGSPQLVPTRVDCETKSIRVNTVAGSMKHREISHDPLLHWQ